MDSVAAAAVVAFPLVLYSQYGRTTVRWKKFVSCSGRNFIPPVTWSRAPRIKLRIHPVHRQTKITVRKCWRDIN